MTRGDLSWTGKKERFACRPMTMEAPLVTDHIHTLEKITTFFVLIFFFLSPLFRVHSVDISSPDERQRKMRMMMMMEEKKSGPALDILP